MFCAQKFNTRAFFAVREIYSNKSSSLSRFSISSCISHRVLARWRDGCAHKYTNERIHTSHFIPHESFNSFLFAQTPYLCGFNPSVRYTPLSHFLTPRALPRNPRSTHNVINDPLCKFLYIIMSCPISFLLFFFNIIIIHARAVVYRFIESHVINDNLL